MTQTDNNRSFHTITSRICICPVTLILLFICNAASGFATVQNNKATSFVSHRNTHQHHIQMSTSNGQSNLHEIKAGFLGCGTIAYSIATALANPAHSTYLEQNSLSLSSIHVTRRSESRSSQLRQAYPDVVTVCENVVDVVKNSQIVFLCVLPEHVEGVLDELRDVWNEDEHTLVSLVSTSKVDDLIQKTSLPKASVYKMICLPPISNREGCALLQPPAKDHPYLKPMLDALGGCVECANDEVMNAMMIPGCLMGPMYGIMRNNREWLVKQGVSPEDASYFLGRTYLSIVQDAERNSRNPNRFDELIEEQTPGGLNEQSLRNLEQQGVFEAYNNAMDAIKSRLEGKSDGSLPTSTTK